MTLLNFLIAVRNFKNDDNTSIPETYRKANSLVFLIYDPSENNGHGLGTYTEVNDITIYDTYLKTLQDQSITSNTPKKLILGIKILINNTTEQVVTLNGQKTLQIKTDIITSINNILKTVKKNLLDSTNSLVTVNNNDIADPSNIPLDGNVYTNDNQYVGIDISPLYQKVYKQTQQFLKDKSDSQNQLLTKVNQIVESQLGMKPTIYNIFKIICNDIDYFFNIIRNTAIDAERHHEKYKDLILSNNDINDIKDNKETIFAFPLFIKKIYDRCGNATETRMYPLDVSNKLGTGNEFPELLLVNKFIQTFLDIQKDNLVKDMRIKEDTQGNLNWIPIDSYDSSFGLTNNQKNSPYFNVESSGGSVDNILNTLIKRYYVLSQDIYSSKFYDNKQDLVEFFAKGEAVNLASSLKNDVLINNLLTQTQRFSNIQFFYGFINTSQNDLYNFNDNNIILDNVNYCVNKYDAKYEPITILSYDDYIKKRVDGEDSDTIVGNYMKSLKPTFLYIFNKPSGDYYNFTTENLVVVNDLNLNNNATNGQYVSRYLAGFKDNDSNDFITLWSYELSYFDTGFFKVLNDSAQVDLSILIMSSNFGYSLSPYSTIKDINSVVFNTSALIEIPYYIAIYIGSIIKLIKSKNGVTDDEKLFYNSAINNKNLLHNLKFINSDIDDFQNYFPLGTNSEKVFTDFYNNFIGDGNIFNNSTINFNNLKSAFIDLYAQLTNKNDTPLNKSNFYTTNLNSTYKANISDILTEKMIITNYNQITFSKKNSAGNTYISLNTIVTTPSDPGNKKKATDNFFKIFFQRLNQELQAQKTNIKNIENEFKKSIDDDDIWNQLYYSFKNISDKWIPQSPSIKIDND